MWCAALCLAAHFGGSRDVYEGCRPVAYIPPTPHPPLPQNYIGLRPASVRTDTRVQLAFDNKADCDKGAPKIEAIIQASKNPTTVTTTSNTATTAATELTCHPGSRSIVARNCEADVAAINAVFNTRLSCRHNPNYDVDFVGVLDNEQLCRQYATIFNKAIGSNGFFCNSPFYLKVTTYDSSICDKTLEILNGIVNGFTTTTVTTTTTTTATTATATTATATTATATTTTTTTTTTTILIPGLDCAFDAQCSSGACRTHCCDAEQNNSTDQCSFCDSVDGSCYAPLTLNTGWNPTTALADGWGRTYNKDARSELDGPPPNFTSTTLLNRKGTVAQIRFRLLWSVARNTIPTDDSYGTGTPPSTGLVTAGEGADPGLFDVDSNTGAISALPRRNGNYTLFLVADDSIAGSASARGLPAQLDQVIVKRWRFTVVGKPDFVVTSYARQQADVLPTVSSGEDPFITRTTVGTVSCTVGTMSHIAPINPAALVYDHASGGGGAKIQFTIRNPPPGFFIEPSTGEVQGNPQATTAGETFVSTLLAIDPAGQEAVLEKITFTILPKPRFQLASTTDTSQITFEGVGLQEQQSPSSQNVSNYLDPSATAVQYAIGSTITFPALQQSASELFVDPAFGDFGKVTYKRSFGASFADPAAGSSPGLWLVDTETAEMLAQPKRPGNYSVSLVATDGLGAEVVFRSWSFEVLLKDTDVPAYGPNGVDCQIHGERVDDANIFDNSFKCDCAGTDYTGDNCEVKIEPAVCASNEALVAGVCKPFQLAVAASGERTAAGPEFTNPSEMETTYYTVRDFASYRIAPLAIDDVLTNYSSGNRSGVTYTMVGDSENFFLNTKTGQMLGTFDNFLASERAATKTFSITVQAIDSSGIHQDLETIAMRVRYPDLEVDEYGPNGMPCKNNGTRLDGVDGTGDVFDQAYVCACIRVGKTTYSGDNCELETVDAPAASATGGSGNTPVVAGAMAGAVVFLFVAGLIVYKRRMHTLKMKAFDFEAEVARLINAGEIDESGDGNSGPKIPREIKRSHITMIQMIGEGAFGEVWKAVLDESSTQGGVPGYQVAVKTSKEAKGEGADEMLREATVMAQVSGHPNLVSLIGVVTSGVPLLLAISMCENGSLLSLLKERKLKTKAEGKLQFTLAERIGFAIDTAKGMAHLTANSFVHRDLAARNVLVDATMTCKVADFGLARGIAGARAGPDTNEDGDEEEYYRSRTGTFPVRWTSPEAMQTMRFSEATDVWSFGIVMIELFTDGGKPYAGMANAAVISKVQGGYRAKQPKLCSDAVYTVMLQCWCAKPADRPTFVQLETLLQTAVEDAGVATTSNATSGGAGKTSKKKKKKTKKTSTTKADQRQAVAVNDTYMSDAPAEATRAGSRQSVAVNDTYMTDEPAPAGEMADQYLTVDNAGGAVDAEGEAGADDEYLSVAAGLHNGTIDDGLDSGSDIEL